MKKLWMTLVLSIVYLSVLGSDARAFELDIYGGLNFSKVEFSPAYSSPTSSKMGMTYGAGIGWSAFPGFAFEADVLFSKRKFESTPGTDISGQYLEIPLIFKATMIPMVSFGAGLYYATSPSDKLTSTTGGVDTEISFGSLNAKRNEFGWLLEAGGSFPIVPTLSFKVDLRYFMGLTNTSTDPTRSDKSKGFQTLAGLSFGF